MPLLVALAVLCVAGVPHAGNLALAPLGGTAGASAEMLAPTRVANLRLAGGSGWHADNSFRLDWDLEAAPGAVPIAAIHYRVRYPDGRDAVAERTLPRVLRVESIHLPADGAYTAEVWAVDANGLSSARASIAVLLDQARPGTTRPLPPSGWIAGEAATHLRLSHPEGPEPPSGLRGYAISIDADPAGTPCAGVGRCSDPETDLRGGIGDDSLVLAGLPEGHLFIHAVAVSGSGMSSEAVGTAPIWVDATAPRVSLAGVPSGWVIGPTAILADASDGLSGMTADGPLGPFTSIAIDGGTPTVAAGGSARVLVSGNGIHRVEVRARDAAGNLSVRAGNPPLTATVKIDGTPPSVAFANRPDPEDPERVEALAADTLSGVSGRRGTIAVRPARSRQRFAPLPTSVESGRLLARWDPDAHPTGSYEFQATAYDEAGNSASTVLRGNGTRMTVVSSEKSRTSLHAGFGRRFAASLETPCGHGAELSGSLTTANGSPLAGEEVVLAEALDGGTATARTRSLRTAADGSFTAQLGPGPSRRLLLTFAGSRGRAPSSAPPLRLESRACVTLRASTPQARIGGRPVIFSGRVGPPGAPPSANVPVALQFRLPGLPWSEFRTVTTNRRGRFRYPYAFADDDSRGAHFQFRAVVAAHDGWPYATGTSRPVAVTGT
ncbi:MAG: hypothetical protein ABW065_14180 [Solirubrobacterales bacterium]